MEIQIQTLKKNYGRKAALDSISLTIGNGMFGLLGRNGAGKTTLMQILSTLREPDSGSVTFDGIPLSDTRNVRPLIGYLPQEFSLYPDMPVLEIMRYLAALSDLPMEVQRQRIPDLLQRVNLWEDRGKKVRKLSGGMKRRLGIAQALLHDPQVLIADEPTVGLDPQERLRFYALLNEFSSNRIVIVSAKSAGLLPLSRLRTVRDGFPSYSSSISSRFCAAFQKNSLTMFVDIGHIWRLVLASHGFRNFIENLPFIADFHGQAAVIAASILISPNLFEFPGQPLHSILKFALGKIFGVQIRVCVHSYFCMSDNGDLTQPHKLHIIG